MRKRNSGLRRELLHAKHLLLNILHTVGQEKDLPAASDFPIYRFTDQLLVLFHDKGLNRMPLLRRFL